MAVQLLKTAFLGDSKTEMSTDAFKVYKTASSYPAYAEMCTNGKAFFRHNYNHGVSSETTAQIAARVPNVLAAVPKPDVCVVFTGTNDYLSGSGGSEVALSNAIIALGDALNVGGVQPVICSCPVMPDFSHAERNRCIRTNQRLRENCPYPIADLALIGEEILQFPADWETSGASYDGTHENPVAYYAYGECIAGVLDRFMIAVDPGSNQFGAGAPGSLLTASGLVTAPAVGQAPTGWQVGGTAAVRVARNVLSGEFLADQYTLFISEFVTLGTLAVSVGQETLADWDIEFYGDNVSKLQLEVQYWDASTQLATGYWGVPYLGAHTAPTHMRGRARVQAPIVPSGTTRMRMGATIIGPEGSGRGYAYMKTTQAALRIV